MEELTGLGEPELETDVEGEMSQILQPPKKRKVLDEEEKKIQLEKKRIWAENFLRSFYKQQELKQAIQEGEKNVLAIITESSNDEIESKQKTPDVVINEIVEDNTDADYDQGFR